MSSSYDTFVHLIAGGTGGTIGAIVTCPLEVVKTRLQSSKAQDTLVSSPSSYQTGGGASASNQQLGNVAPGNNHSRNEINVKTKKASIINVRVSNYPIIQCFKTIIKNEGWKALFKGFGPNLVGIAPSRAVYFSTYSYVKHFLNSSFQQSTEHPLIHMTSAASAGFISCTTTNPIWLIKTRVQLSKESMTVMQCMRSIYQTSGALGFYKGITASYFGISETIIHFVIYESIKSHIKQRRNKLKSSSDSNQQPTEANPIDRYIFLQYMFAGAFSKSCATTITYPHEVARTRLREPGTRYKTFVQTILLVWREEGMIGLYRGLSIHIFRAIPFTAITMSTYELVVSLLSRHKKPNI